MLQVVSKIRSQRGASLSIALFLFLVCAMVASVVLVAGTAASGRLADLGKADKHYYSVASAIELMKKQLEEERDNNSHVKVEETLSYEEVREGNAYKYKVTNNTVLPPAELSSEEPSSEESPLQKTLGTTYATGLALSGTWETSLPTSIPEEEWYSALIKWEDTPVKANNTSCPKLKLGCAGDSGLPKDLPEVTLSIEFMPDGSAKVTFKSSPEGDICYTAYATLVPDFAISTNVIVNADGNIDETKTIDLCWELCDITGERAM